MHTHPWLLDLRRSMHWTGSCQFGSKLVRLNICRCALGCALTGFQNWWLLRCFTGLPHKQNLSLQVWWSTMKEFEPLHVPKKDGGASSQGWSSLFLELYLNFKPELGLIVVTWRPNLRGEASFVWKRRFEMVIGGSKIVWSELETNNFNKKERGTNLETKLLKVRGTCQGRNSFTLPYQTPFRNRHFQTCAAFPSRPKFFNLGPPISILRPAFSNLFSNVCDLHMNFNMNPI